MTQRWVLTDAVAGESWTMPINPDSMVPVPLKIRVMTFAGGWRRDQRVRTFVGKSDTPDWGWSGVIRSQAHYDELVRWTKKTNEITVTDHMSRTYVVFLTAFDPTDRPPSRSTQWRLRYSMKAKLLEETA